MKHAVQHIHFVGIGGSGMSGIAEILHALGYTVSGSDQADSTTLKRLGALGIKVHVGHAAEQVGAAQVLVVSSAVAADNPELLAARALGLPVVARAVMLAELMRLKKGIAIAGTHGKTTTTSLVAAVLGEEGLKPTFVIGGKLNSAGANSQLGAGELIVVEADESDGSFLNLLPMWAIVTNIDADHMATYGHSVDKLRAAFVEFLHKMPFYGVAIVCGDDPGVQAITAQVERPLRSYGFERHNSFRAVDVQALPAGRMRFRCERDGLPDLAVTLNLAGRHNVLNALAVITLAAELEVSDAALLRAFETFGGVGRRFQSHGELSAPRGGRFTLIDDYGHHPVEMRAVLDAARGAYPGQRIVLAFQPHRYSRTHDCFDAFVEVFKSADLVLLTEVYAAGEIPIDGASGRELAAACGASFVPDYKALPQAIADAAQDGDIVIVMGAGSIAAVPALTEKLLS
ncbi:MAG TPA: UDP-N-acetylmuramate--L-alanine ligase [Burkholderiaceae bacterium]